MIFIIILILLLPVLTFIFHKREVKYTIIYFDLKLDIINTSEKFAYLHGRTFIGNVEYKNVMIVKDGEYIIYLQSPCHKDSYFCIDNNNLSTH